MPRSEDASASDQDGAGVVSVFQPISHPVLRSVDRVKVAVFLRELERYEIEITEKKKEVPSLTKASYKVSINQGLLRRMHFMGKLNGIAPDKDFNSLTATDIKKFIESLAKKEPRSFNPTVIEKALAGLHVPMHIGDPEARMFEYCNDFFERLEVVGYDSFKDENPKMVVELLQEKLYPRLFREIVGKAVKYQETIQNDVQEFIMLLCSEAEAYEKYCAKDSGDRSGNGESGKQQVKGDASRSKKKGKDYVSGETRQAHKNKPVHQLPLCLNEECAKQGLRRFVLEGCDRTSKEEARRLIREHRDKKRKTVKQVTKRERLDDNQNSTLVNAMFEKRVLRVLCADGESNINLMPPDRFKELFDKGASIKIQKFEIPRKYGLALYRDQHGEELSVLCDKQVTTNVELFVRHGRYLELRNLTWYVAMGEVPEPLLGRPVLEALGINTKELLVAATDRIGSSVDMGALLKEQNYPEGSVARILQQGVFYNDRGLSAETFDDEDDSWLDLGHDTKEEMDEVIKKTLEDARKHGISEDGYVRLRKMLQQYRDVLRLRLGNDPPADVEPMKIELVAGAKPVQAEPRRYPPEGRRFMERYVNRAIEFGFGKVTTTAKRVAAPVLVAKPAPDNYRLTFDYRPVNAVTVPTTWPMPHIDSELVDLEGSKFFASIDFVSGYWQLPLEEKSQEALNFMTSSKVVQPMRCTQGAKNAGPNFQAKVEPLFCDIRTSLKAWLDDFMLHSKTEGGLLDVLEQFCAICRKRRLKIGIVKSKFFWQRIKWCGRLIDGEGVRYDPRKISGLRDIHEPKTAAGLCEYVHCLQWMSAGVPEFVNRIAPLRKVLEEAYTKSGSRTKKSILGF